MTSTEPSPDTATRILDAARDAMAEHGLDATLQQVAELAGTSRMTIYRHFETREQLLTTLVLRESQEMADHLTEILSDDWRSFRERMTDVIMYVITTVRASPHLDAIVSGTSPAAAWPRIDVDNRLVDATKAFLLPHVQRAAQQGLTLRASPEHALDWLLRVTLMLMSVEPGMGSDADALRHEVQTFVLPSVIVD
jgi:AcrR family transcriptional regulator